MTERFGGPLRVIIMGCGRTGSRLAGMLDRAGHQITVVDWNPGAFSRLPDQYGGGTIVGNGVDQDVLRRAGLAEADAFVAATGGDNRNVVASEIAKMVFQVPRVIARIKDPDRAHYFNQLGMRVDCRTEAGARALLEIAERELSQQAV